MSIFESRPQLLVIDCGSSKVSEIIAIAEDEGWTVTCLDFTTAFDYDVSGFEAAIIFSGGPHLFTDPDAKAAKRLRKKFRWTPRLDMPVLGICLGHQALALAAGAEIFRGPERREPEAIRIERGHPLLSGLSTSEQFTEDHCEGISLPEGYSLLASSEHYEVEAMANDSLMRYGVQFHPEVSGKPGRRLIANFLRLAVLRSRPTATPIFTAASLIPILWIALVSGYRLMQLQVGIYGPTVALAPAVGLLLAAGGLIRRERWQKVAFGAILTYFLIVGGLCCQGYFALTN